MNRKLCGALLCLGLLFPVMLGGHGALDEQIAGLDQRIQREPLNAKLYLQRGDLHRLLRHWIEAERDFNRAGELDKKLAAVHHSRALLLLESERPQAALSSIDRFLIFEPQRAGAHETRGRILARVGRNREAVAAFTRAIRLVESPTPDLYFLRNEAILALGPSAFKEALNGLDEGIARLGPIVTLELAAIELERRMKNWSGALRRVDQLALSSPRKETWLVRRAEILTEAGRQDEARQAYVQALAAIEALPARHHNTPATKRLEAEVRKHVEQK